MMRPIHLDAGDRYCVLRQGTAWFAVPAIAVREVLPRPSITSVPGLEGSVAGLCHLRTGFLPVLSLGSLLGEHTTANSAGAQLLVMNDVHGAWGLLLDEVVGLDSLEVCVNSDGQLARDWTSAVLGSATSRNQVVRVLDPQALYRHVDESLKSPQVDAWERASQSDAARDGGATEHIEREG
jgi:purine-binding chemotaxis protein CheW